MMGDQYNILLFHDILNFRTPYFIIITIKLITFINVEFKMIKDPLNSNYRVRLVHNIMFDHNLLRKDHKERTSFVRYYMPLYYSHCIDSTRPKQSHTSIPAATMISYDA